MSRRAQREGWFLFTTNFVLAESHALILARMGRDQAWSFLQAIVTGRTNVIHAEDADERQARAIIQYYRDKAFSYCDAVSFAVMERLEIQEAIAFETISGCMASLPSCSRDSLQGICSLWPNGHVRALRSHKNG